MPISDKLRQGMRDALRLPVVALSAEHLTIGHLMRRNVLAYKAPPNAEGYDLICIHPDPRVSSKPVRVQVKSRYQTDCNRVVMVKGRMLDACDYLVVAFLNIGNFYRKPHGSARRIDAEFYTLPSAFVREHHSKTSAGWERIKTRKLALDPYKNDEGFEQIARDLGVDYPSR